MNYPLEILDRRIYLMYILNGPESNSAHAVILSVSKERMYIGDKGYVGRYTKCVHKKIIIKLITHLWSW
jgi:hypothetical protein